MINPLHTAQAEMETAFKPQNEFEFLSKLSGTGVIPLLALKYFFNVKLTFEMVTVRGQQHTFSTHERMFLRKCQRF